jgi:hypothetical protein
MLTQAPHRTRAATPNDAGPIANTIRYLKLPTRGELRPQTERDALETRLEPIESRNFMNDLTKMITGRSL